MPNSSTPPFPPIAPSQNFHLTLSLARQVLPDHSGGGLKRSQQEKNGCKDPKTSPPVQSDAKIIHPDTDSHFSRTSAPGPLALAVQLE